MALLIIVKRILISNCFKLGKWLNKLEEKHNLIIIQILNVYYVILNKK